MFPRWQRLTEKRLYARMFRDGSRIKGPDFSLVVMSAVPSGKIGFIVTKKNEKSAVGRNKLKRRLRAAFLHVLDTPPYSELLKKYHIIVVTHRNISDQPFDLLVMNVKSSLDRISSIKTKPAFHGPRNYDPNRRR